MPSPDVRNLHALLPYRSERERSQRTSFVAFAKPSGGARYLRTADGRSRRQAVIALSVVEVGAEEFRMW